MSEATEPSQPIHAANIGETITFLIAVTFAASVIFEMGFSIALGALGMLPLTIGDFTQSAIYWMPASIIGFVLGMWTIGYDEFFRLTDRRSLPSTEASVKAILAKMHRTAIIVALAYISAAAIVWVLFGAIFFSAFLIFGVVGYWLGGASGKDRAPREQFVRVVVPLTIGLFALGYCNAALRVAGSLPTARIRDNQEQVEVQFVRSYERGIAYIDEGKVSFAFWDDVASLHATDEVVDVRLGYVCRFIECAHERASVPGN